MKSIVLTIDDDPVVRKLANKAVESLGYRSVEVPSGLEGLNYLEKNFPQLILLDIMMPMIDGFEVLRKIKSHKEWRSIPVIMFSAVSDEVKVKEALRAGASDYLLKPFRLRTVQEKVTQMLDQRSNRLRDELVKPVEETGIHEMPDVVMIVTTNSLVQHRFSRLLRQRNIRLLHANGAIEGMRLLDTSTPDMVVIDDNLKVFNGGEFEAKMRQNPKWKTIPSIGIADSKNGYQYMISRSSSDLEILQTISKVWGHNSAHRTQSKIQDDIDISNYRIMLMMSAESEIQVFQEKAADAFQLKIVDSSTDLIGNLVSWKPDFVILNYDEYGEDVHGILKRCKEAVRGESQPYFLFSREEYSEQDIQKIKKSGFENVILYLDDDTDFITLLDEAFGVNLIEEQPEENLVVLRRRPVKNYLAGREVIHRILFNRNKGIRKFIIDFSSVDSIAFNELQYLGQITNYQTRFGIRLCAYSTSPKVTANLQSFEETAGAKVFDALDDAREYLATQSEKSSTEPEEA